jgi:hypothetical protein
MYTNFKVPGQDLCADDAKKAPSLAENGNPRSGGAARSVYLGSEGLC